MMDSDDVKLRKEKLREAWLHWARMPAWSLHEASAVVCGIIPTDKWSHNGLSRGHYSFGKELDTRYLRIWDLLLREELTYNLSFPVTLKDLYNWAEKARIPISQNFLSALRFLDRLPGEVAPLEEVSADQDNSTEAELGTRERDTLLYMIATMSIKKYDFTPRKRNSAVSEILKDMEAIGTDPISADTVRNKLKEASDLVPQSYFSKSEGQG
jgi:hypothetical protein